MLRESRVKLGTNVGKVKRNLHFLCMLGKLRVNAEKVEGNFHSLCWESYGLMLGKLRESFIVYAGKIEGKC